jgi:hypothetical protein
MGWHFKEISKIDAFSVNQMNSERSAVRYERPEYRYVTSKWKLTEPTAFQSKTGEWWKGNGFDLQVYHPRTRYERGRPAWLRMAYGELLTLYTEKWRKTEGLKTLLHPRRELFWCRLLSKAKARMPSRLTR